MARSRFVLSLIPKNGFGFARINSRSRNGSTVIWSSPPLDAMTAVEPILRVVGYSTGSRPYSLAWADTRSSSRPEGTGRAAPGAP